MTQWGIHIPPLITITGSVSLSQFGLELILLVGGTFTDALSQTDHNCFFIIVVGCSTANTWQTEGGKKTGEDCFTNTHIFFFDVPPPPSVVDSASREHQDFSLPKKPSGAPPPKPSVQTSGAGPPHNVSTQPGRCWTGTPSCLAGWLMAASHAFSSHTPAPSLRWPHHQYAWHWGWDWHVWRRRVRNMLCVCHSIHLWNTRSGNWLPCMERSNVHSIWKLKNEYNLYIYWYNTAFHTTAELIIFS